MPQQFDHGFIAEKPSLAKHVAEARAEQLGVTAVKKDGYWEVGPDFVTWFIGHMYEQAQPGEYDEKYRGFGLQTLPIVVGQDQWKLVAKTRPKFDDHIVAQMAAIHRNNLFRSAKVLVNVGDAEREGQLLVDEVLLVEGIDPFGPAVKRLWVSSMARKDLLAALAAMIPNAEKRNLYNSAVCRQRADFLHGMNYSRLYTELARAGGARDAKFSVGRVMTPTLRLVVDRDRERIYFKPVDHYVPSPTFRHENGTFKAAWIVPAEHDGLDSEGRLVDKAVAESICQQIQGKPGRISAFKAETKYTQPPLPFSLSALQTECGSKLNMTAQEVLDTAQSLYETHKATTYPRSDSRHLPTTILKDEAPGILQALAGVADLEAASTYVDPKLRSSAWDDSKVSDHHGIIPTSEFSAALLDRMSAVERDVFMIIARTFLAQFLPAYKYKSVSAEVSCENHRFKAGGRLPIDPGWKRAFGAQAPDEEEEGEGGGQNLPAMAQGDAVTAEGAELAARRTSPPPGFTDGTLIEAMANIHRFVTNPEIKKRLRENGGIGTEATRSPTLEKLLSPKVGMLKRKGKTGIESTEFGRSIIDALPEDLKDAGLSALWEGMLDKVKEGSLDADAFMAKTTDSIVAHVDRVKKVGSITVKGVAMVRPIEGHGDACPKCGSGTLVTQEIGKGEHKGKKFLRCTDSDCDYRFWPQAKVDPLPGHGKDCPACGTGKLLTREVTTKAGNKAKLLSCNNYPACKHGEWPQVPPIEGHGGDCPKCGTGKMLTREVKKEGPNKGKKFLGCDNPECKHAQFPEDKVDPIDGHGKPCPKCGKGAMLTRQITSTKEGPNKGKKYIILACSGYPDCKHSEFPEPVVDPIAGHGEPCPKCGKGTMKTKQITSNKEGPNKGKKYVLLACTNYPDCKHSQFPEPAVDPLPGHGKPCPECGKGVLNTKQITAKSGQTHVLLSCTNYPACKHGEWPDRPDSGPVDPLPGHGKTCPKCGKGTMKTKKIKGKDGKEHVLLSCDAYPNCKNSEFPDSGDKGGKGGGRRG